MRKPRVFDLPAWAAGRIFNEGAKGFIWIGRANPDKPLNHSANLVHPV